MISHKEHFSAYEIQDWFSRQWQQQGTQGSKKQLALLKHIFSKPLHNIPIKQQVISDARNYLNALPTSYLYYSLAKEYFPVKKQKLRL